MLLVQKNVRVSSEARRALGRMLGEPILFVVDTKIPASVLQQAIGKECSRQNLSIERRIQVAHMYIGEPSLRTRDRIRLAQQLAGLHVILHRNRDTAQFTKGDTR
jgi:hypothetical protein